MALYSTLFSPFESSAMGKMQHNFQNKLPKQEDPQEQEISELRSPDTLSSVGTDTQTYVGTNTQTYVGSDSKAYVGTNVQTSVGSDSKQKKEIVLPKLAELQTEGIECTELLGRGNFGTKIQSH